MMKLGWEILPNPKKTWVKLIFSKYLRDKKLLDYLVDNKGASWVWRGIVANKDKVKDIVCFKVRNPTFGVLH